jgi:hypothetical protein
MQLILPQRVVWEARGLARKAVVVEAAAVLVEAALRVLRPLML